MTTQMVVVLVGVCGSGKWVMVIVTYLVMYKIILSRAVIYLILTTKVVIVCGAVETNILLL